MELSTTRRSINLKTFNTIAQVQLIKLTLSRWCFFPEHCPCSTLPHYDIKWVEIMILVLLNAGKATCQGVKLLLRCHCKHFLANFSKNCLLYNCMKKKKSLENEKQSSYKNLSIDHAEPKFRTSRNMFWKSNFTYSTELATLILMIPQVMTSLF